MENLLGVEIPPTVTFLIAFIVVLALIGLLAWVVRRFGAGRADAALRGRQPRLGVVEAAAVDTRRKLVILRRDNVEHLVMIGGPTDVVVESNIVRVPMAATRESAARNGAAHLEPSAWPLQPQTEPTMREERLIEELPEFAPAPPSLPPRHYSEPTVAEPTPMPPQRQPRPERPVAKAAPEASDANLAEMAQRLEAALRRPAAADAPTAKHSPAATRPTAEVRRAEPRTVEPRTTDPRRSDTRPAAAHAAPAASAPAQPSRDAAAESKSQPPAQSAFESLEQEMASLLGRPGKT